MIITDKVILVIISIVMLTVLYVTLHLMELLVLLRSEIPEIVVRFLNGSNSFTKT